MMEIKLKEGNDGYDAVIDILSMIVPKLYTKYFPGDLIVRIGFKYEEDDKYEYENELLYTSAFADYDCFEDDWWEGQKYISIVGFIPLDDIRHFDYMLSKKEDGTIDAGQYTSLSCRLGEAPPFALTDLEGPAYEVI